MQEDGPDAGDATDSLRRLGGSLLGLVRTRAELFSLELQEEKIRAVYVLLWLGVAVVFGAAGLFVVLGALALFLWRTYGYAGLAGLAAAALAVAVVIVVILRRRILHGPRPFATTVAEFEKDSEWMRPRE